MKLNKWLSNEKLKGKFHNLFHCSKQQQNTVDEEKGVRVIWN